MKKVAQADQAQLRKAVSEYLKTAEKFLKAGEMDKAMKQVEEAIALDPKNAYAHAYKERILKLQGAEEFEKAFVRVEKDLQLTPQLESSIEVEEENRKHGREEELRKAEEKIKRKEAEEKRRAVLREIQIYLERAESFYAKGEFEKALDEIIHAFALDPTHPQAKKLARKVQRAIDEKIRGEEEPWRKAEEEERAAAGIEVAEGQKVKARERIFSRLRAWAGQYILIGSIAAVAIVALVVLSFRETFSPSPPTLVVAPLTNASGNPREDYIADALTAALISDFGIVTDLKVVGIATSLWYKNRPGDLATVGRELRVLYVLSGSARRSGELVEVSVEVRDTIREEKLWSKQYLELPTNLHRVREDVFNSVTELLDIDPPQGPKPFAKPWSTDPEAVNLYLQAMGVFRQGTKLSVLYSIRLFDRALAEDSKFASASAAKAYAFALLYEREWENNPEALEIAAKLAREAIASDPNSVLAYRTLGSVYRQQRSYAAAIEQLQKALAMNPHDVGSHVGLALVHGMQGDVETGIEAATKAVKIDPKNFEAHLAMALVHHLARNYKAAVVSYDQVGLLRPDVRWELLGLYDGALIDRLAYDRAQNFYSPYLESYPSEYTVIYRLARALQIAGRAEASFPHLNKVISLARQELKRDSRSARAHMYIGLALTRLRKFKEGIDAATKAVGFAPGDYAILYKMAGLYSMQNNTEESLKWFRLAVQKRYSFKRILDLDFFNIRNEPEFLQISQNP